MNKKLFISLLLALAAAGIILLVVWLSSLLSWWLVFTIVYTIMVIPTYTAVTIWEEEDCFDLEDFWDAIAERHERLQKKKPSSSSNSCIEEDDYRKYP
jgi:fatty acid desaturase